MWLQHIPLRFAAWLVSHLGRNSREQLLWLILREFAAEYTLGDGEGAVRFGFEQ